MKIKYAVVLICTFLILFFSQAAWASNQIAGSSDTLTLSLENDAFGFDNKDRHYTHGTKISWLSRNLSNYREIEWLPGFFHTAIDRLPVIHDANRLRTLSLSLGQSVYTPEDRARTDLIFNDRPYAGVLYMGLGLHSRNSRFMDSIELVAGLVGRHSYAQDIQKVVHEWTDTLIPQGWEHQLHDEPIVNLYIERKWKAKRLGHAEGLGFDAIPHAGLAVGNAYTGINVGGQMRFGWNLPNDFGTYLIRPGSDANAPAEDTDPRFFQPRHRFGIHGFLALDGRAVARDILLDGNTFRKSHSVNKEPFVADCIGGVGLIIHRFKITYALVYRTKEFKTQSKEQYFGSISISYTF